MHTKRPWYKRRSNAPNQSRWGNKLIRKQSTRTTFIIPVHATAPRFPFSFRSSCHRWRVRGVIISPSMDIKWRNLNWSCANGLQKCLCFVVHPSYSFFCNKRCWLFLLLFTVISILGTLYIINTPSAGCTYTTYNPFQWLHREIRGPVRPNWSIRQIVV